MTEAETETDLNENIPKIEDYFSSYEDLEIHKLMLSDRPRQIAYRNAIISNCSLFAGKTVLDVGAGSGILSIFCAQAGAKKIYAVEASNMAALAREIVKENGFADIIEVHQTKIEQFRLSNDNQKQIDIIVSEWMGFYLLHEGMLDSVIYARDTFLKSGGHMFPQSATISLAPCSVPTMFDAWDEVDAVRMSAFGVALRAQKSLKPEIMLVPADDLLHEGTIIAWLDLNNISLADLSEFIFNEVMVVQREGRYQGLCLWFDVEFPANDEGDAITLSTAPTATATHWKQTVILLPDQAQEDVDVRDPIGINLTMRRNTENTRHYNLEVQILDANEMEHSLPCDCILTKCILIKEHLKSVEGGL